MGMTVAYVGRFYSARSKSGVKAGYRSEFAKIVSLDYGDPELLEKFRAQGVFSGAKGVSRGDQPFRVVEDLPVPEMQSVTPRLPQDFAIQLTWPQLHRCPVNIRPCSKFLSVVG